jgi:type VII secretion effector (TIGR04197 family)
MSDLIYINEDAVENDASCISGAASYFMNDKLVPSDSRTTLTANTAGQQAYANSQQVIEILGENLEREVTNIRSIGATFKEYDTMMAELLRNGTRYPILKSAD